MGNWLESLLAKLAELWPMKKLEPWERGLKIYYLPGFGKRESRTVTRSIGPGSHFIPWWFCELHAESVVPQVMDLLTQTVTLRDGHVVSFSVNIEYEIDDVYKNTVEVHSFVASLEAASRIHLAKRVREISSFTDLVEKQSWLENSLAGTLTTRAKRWGAKINEVGFTDLTPSKAFRLLGDGGLVHG